MGDTFVATRNGQTQVWYARLTDCREPWQIWTDSHQSCSRQLGITTNNSGKWTSAGQIGIDPSDIKALVLDDNGTTHLIDRNGDYGTIVVNALVFDPNAGGGDHLALDSAGNVHLLKQTGHPARWQYSTNAGANWTRFELDGLLGPGAVVNAFEVDNAGGVHIAYIAASTSRAMYTVLSPCHQNTPCPPIGNRCVIHGLCYRSGDQHPVAGSCASCVVSS